MRLPRLTVRSTPVYAGWHCEQTSTWIEGRVERVSNVVPQLLQLTVVPVSSGWIPVFILSSLF